MKNILKNIRYYFWAANRRKIIDKIQTRHTDIFHGVVLDIGGRDRGKYRKPKKKVIKWIFADIEQEFNPDITLDVTDMKNIKDDSIDVINANELFEHVENIEKGLRECKRVLKKNGRILISIPFLKEIHGDPFDFQRWTEDKWKNKLRELGFEIEEFYVTGRFFCVFTNMAKVLIKNMTLVFRLPFQIALYPFLDLLAALDNTFLVLNSKKLKNFHAGYLFIAKNKKI